MKINYRIVEHEYYYALYRYSFIDTSLSEFIDSFIDDIQKELKAEIKDIRYLCKNVFNHKTDDVKLTKFILHKEVYACHVFYDYNEKNIRINVFIYDY